MQVIALVAQGAASTRCGPRACDSPCRGKLTGSDGPSALGACRRAVCEQPSLCRWVTKGWELQDSPDASATHGGVGESKAQDLVRMEGRNGGEKGEDGVSLSKLTMIFFSAEDLHL